MTTLKIAIQKSGRLNQNSLKLLKDCGISTDNGKDQLKVMASNFPLEILYLRNSDIPQYRHRDYRRKYFNRKAKKGRSY